MVQIVRRRSAFILTTLALACVAAALSFNRGAHADAIASVPGPEDALLGEWWMDGYQSRLRFIKNDADTFGAVMTCCAPEVDSRDESLAHDIHNPDRRLRSRSLIGITTIWQLKYEGNGDYSNGFLYSARDGKTYQIKVKLIDPDSLKVRRFIGLPTFGSTEVWKRAHIYGW